MEIVCYGVIPVIFENNDLKLVLLKHKNGGFWGFPKGHREKEETPFEAAQRELYEETGLQIKRVLLEKPLTSNYEYLDEKQTIKKTVYFFVCETTSEVEIDYKEIIDYSVCSFEMALKTISYAQGKALLKEFSDKLPI